MGTATEGIGKSLRLVTGPAIAKQSKVESRSKRICKTLGLERGSITSPHGGHFLVPQLAHQQFMTLEIQMLAGCRLCERQSTNLM